MLFPSFAILAAASSLLSFATAHNIQMKAHQRECFHESLHKDDKMTVTFQVGDREFGGSGNLEIDFWIETPSRSYQVHERGVSSGDHSFDAKEDGKYTYCFNNEHWGANTKEVSFNVHGIVYVPESEAPQDPLEKEVRTMSELVSQVKDEQSYIIVRERVHRNTAESTNARIKWWSIFQLMVLVGQGFFQVWWLKRFFEVRTMSELVSQVKDEQSYIIVRERVHRNTAESTNARIKWWSIFQLMVLVGQGFFQVWWLKRFFEVKRVV